MTNSEAIYVIRKTRDGKSCKTCKIFDECFNDKCMDADDMSIKALEENDKLKAEIERLSNVINALVKASDKQNSEIEQLKQEVSEWKDIAHENEYCGEFGTEDCQLVKKVKQLKAELKDYHNAYKTVERQRLDAWGENHKLKAELEQSVKLPCKVGDNYVLVFNSYGELFTTIGWNLSEITIINGDIILDFYCSETMEEEQRSLNSFGKTIFNTEEEAEQALKGGE